MCSCFRLLNLILISSILDLKKKNYPNYTHYTHSKEQEIQSENENWGRIGECVRALHADKFQGHVP